MDNITQKCEELKREIQRDNTKNAAIYEQIIKRVKEILGNTDIVRGKSSNLIITDDRQVL